MVSKGSAATFLGCAGIQC